MNFEVAVRGDYALFADPLLRMGGEKMSYQVPTYSALEGIIESIYWKPSIDIIIDKVRIMNKIKLEPIGVKPRHFVDDKNDLSIYTYLKDVYYQVRFHIELSKNMPTNSTSDDLNLTKHESIMKRSIERGGRCNVFLGTSECSAFVCPEKFGSGTGYYDNNDIINLGVMLHSIGYKQDPGNRKNSVPSEQLLYSCSMKNGVIDFSKITRKDMFVRSIDTELKGDCK